MNKNTLLKTLNTLLDAECAALLEQLEPLKAALCTEHARVNEGERRLRSALTAAQTLNPEREIARQHYLATHTAALEQTRAQARALATEESLLNTQHRQHAIRKKQLERFGEKLRREHQTAEQRSLDIQLDEWVLNTWRPHENH